MKSSACDRRTLPGTAGLVVAVALALLTPRPASAQVEAHIVGADGSGVSVAVILEVHDGQQIVYQQEAQTDAAGVARWTEIPTDENLHARVRATYDGAEYVSPVVALVGGAASLDLTVLPVAHAGRPLHLDTMHLIVQADEPGLLRVLQFMTVSNAGEAAFAGGPSLADGRPAGLVIPVPDGALEVRPAPFPTPDDALDGEQAQFDTDRILDARPVPPDGRQVAITYDLVVENGAADVDLLLPYPTQNVSLLLGGPAADGLSLESEQLRAEGTQAIGEQSYEMWVGEALAPGTELAFRFAPPGWTFDPAQVGLLAASAGLLLAVAASLFGGSSRRYTESQRDAIIATIAAIDDAHAAGEMADGDYFHRRGRELDRLALLARSQQAGPRASA